MSEITDATLTPDDAQTYDVPPQVSLFDNMAAARLAGYQWNDIHDHVENAADQAMAAGYTPSQIDGHLGLTGNAGLIDRLGMAASEATAPSLINPDAEPGKTVGPITPDIAHEYAASLTAGEVTSPTEFGDAYAQAHGHDGPQFGKDMAPQLPTLEDTTDHAIAQLHLNGEDLTPDNVSVTRANMLDFWAQTGGTPDDILNSGDPLIQDAMTKPQPPNMPTLEELSKIGRDQISTAVPIIPGGDMTTDPTGLLGMAKSILELPGEELDHLKEVYQNPGTTLADRYEQLRNDPLLNTVSSVVLQALGAKVAGVSIPKVVELAKEAGKATPGVMYDTTGAIDIGEAIAGGKKSYADRAAELEAAQKGEKPPENTPVKSTLTSGELTPEQTAALQNGTRVEIKNPTTGEVHVGEGATPQEAMKSLAPKVAEAAKDTVDNLGKARVEPAVPVERDPNLQKTLRDEFLEPADLEDDLNRLRTNDVQDKKTLMAFADNAVPDEISQDQAKMSSVSRDVEKRIIDPNHEFSDETKTVLDMMRPLTDRQLELGKMIAEKTSNRPMEEIEGIKSVDEGHVHRVVKGNEGIQSLLDPETEVNPITGARPRSLSKFAPGMEKRADFYMFQKDGARTWGKKPMKELGENPATGKPYTYGDTYEDPTGKYTIERSTMDENEANVKGLQYRDHFLANTATDVARLERVNRNLDFLNKWLPGLEKHNLFVKAEGKFKFQQPDGMIRVNLPGVNGWADPKFGRPLNDFFDAKPSDLEGFLTKAARWLQGSLFITPFKHIYNVGKHFIPARGWDWVKPSGYGSLMRNGAIAMREVATNGPLYERFHREGSGLLYAGTQTQNFHRVMFEKFYGEMQADRGGAWSRLARALQLDHLSDLVKAVYKWSNHTLWKYGDVMMLARQLELAEKGMPVRQAIYQAEKDIPNYRIPSEVMGRPEMAQFLKNPSIFSFGRYRYGQTRSLYLMVKDLVGSKDTSRYATGHERLEAIGKSVAMAGMVMGATPLLNYGLTAAWHAAGQSGNADMWAGPETLIRAAYGIATGQKTYLAAMGSWLSLSLIMDLAAMIKTGKDALGRDIVNGSSSVTGKVIQLLEAAGNLTYPGQLLLNALKPGGLAKSGMNLLGFNAHKEVSPEDQAKFDKRDKAAALKRESNDPIEQLIHNTTGLGPDLNISSGKDRSGTRGMSKAARDFQSGATDRIASYHRSPAYDSDAPLSAYGSGGGGFGGRRAGGQGFAGDAATILGQNPYGARTALRSGGGSIGRAGGRTLSTGQRRAIAIRYRGRR